MVSSGHAVGKRASADGGAPRKRLAWGHELSPAARQPWVQALVTRWVGNVFVKYLQNEMQPPPGGLAEVARSEWKLLTRPESLRRLVSLGREQLNLASSTDDKED